MSLWSLVAVYGATVRRTPKVMEKTNARLPNKPA